MEEKHGNKSEELRRTETAAGSGTSAGSSTSRTSSAGTSTGTSAGTNKENKQAEKSPQLVAVNVPEEKPKKKKPVKKKPAAKKQNENMSGDMISDLIVGCSQAVAVIPDQAHWAINKDEAKQIADPLVKVIEKNESLKKVAEQSDSIALVMACAMVFGPRAYISIMAAKEKRAAKKRAMVAKEVKHDVPETRKTERGSEQNHKRNADASTNVGPALHELLSI